MRLKSCATNFFLIAGMAALPVGAGAAVSRSCVAGKPTAESYTWDFKAEATRLLDGIQADARKARDRADKVKTFGKELGIGWEEHADQLTAIKRDINDMGRKLCRLEEIRRVLEPWQQQAIDRIAPQIRLAANSTQDAILFLNRYQNNFWRPTYEDYAENVYRDCGQVAHSVGNLQEYAEVHSQDLHLAKELGLKAGA